MPRTFYKFKILLDEGFLPRKRLPVLNSRYDVKHITSDLNNTGLKDPEVYDLANKLGRIVVTFNDKDFKNLTKVHDKSGVIGVSANMTAEQIDNKITSLLTKSKESDICGKFIYISGEKE